ncbi:MAG TPA: metal-dependent transcriptional regulator [Patescibacteria group bacterium]|jgi:DtxR family Mn-dependent transcriptional regulator|nr:metal-dependent transcriptional regulator [Patescibacteria group bacterium]
MSPDIDTLASGSSRQRDGLNHQAIEDYLKTVYMLEQEESPVSTSRIATARSVRPGSATSMIQRLHKLNLVHYEKHRGVTLTDSGRVIALEVVRHHRLVELYLIEALGFSWDEVHEQADILEHVISEKLEEKIAAALNNPEFDPHGDPIPSKEGHIVETKNERLTALSAGTSAIVSRIPDDADSDLLRYLGDLGLVPGNEIEVVDLAPFDGPLSVLIAGETRIIGFKVADSVLVERL